MHRYQPLVIGSDGDLQCHANPTRAYNLAYWTREEHRFTAVGLPDGLTLDEDGAPFREPGEGRRF